MSKPPRLKMLKPQIPTMGGTLLSRGPRQGGGGGWMADGLRGNSNDRGYGHQWRKLRERVLLRDRGLCQPCLQENHVTQATQVDHIVQKADGGNDGEANLQAICEACHKAKTARESHQ